MFRNFLIYVLPFCALFLTLYPADKLFAQSNVYDGAVSNVLPHGSEVDVAALDSDFSVEFCIRPTQGPNGQYRAITHKGTSNSERTFAIWLYPSDMRLHYTLTSTGNANEATNSAGQLPLNQPTKVSYVREGAKLKLYLNGVLDSERTLSGAVISNTGPLYIGKSPWYSGFGGQIADYFVYGYAITPAQAGCTIPTFPNPANPLVITEFMASNSSTLADQDGAFSDWIEIHNSGSSPVNLQGYGLSDDSSLPQQWIFPNVTLNAGGYLVVFASGKNRAVAGNELHTNFKLSASGEYLGLSAPDGTNVYAYTPKYPSQLTDVSYGIDSSGNAVFYSDPTPNAVNSGSTVPAPVTFSVPHGYYNSPQSVALGSVTPGVNIRYTLDSSEPTAASTLYTAPLNVSSSTIIRARAFAPSGEISKGTTQTYLFVSDILTQDATPPTGWPTGSVSVVENGYVNQHILDYGLNQTDVANNSAGIASAFLSLPAISLVTDVDNLFDATSGIYVNSYQRGREWERLGSVELIDPSGTDPGFTANVGVRLRGEASRNYNNPKHSFRLFFRDEYGDPKLTYPLFGDEGADTFEKIDLRTSQNYSWAWGGNPQNTLVRELWSRDTQGAMGQPYTRSNYYHLFLNGQYWGIYQTHERISKEFAEEYMGGDAGSYDVIKSENYTDPVTGERARYTLASDGNLTAWNQLWDLVSDQVVTEAEYSIIAEQVDLKNLADYFLLFFLSGDFDSSPAYFLGFGGQRYVQANNMYGARNRDGGKWHFFEHDSEHSLCTTIGDRADMPTQLGYDNSGPWLVGDANPRYRVDFFNPAWLFQALLTNDNFVQIVKDRVQLHVLNPDGVLQLSANVARFNQRVAEVSPAIEAHAARWGDRVPTEIRTKADWLAEIDFVVNTCLPDRQNMLNTILTEDGLMPLLSPPTATPIIGNVALGANVSLNHANGTGTIYYTTDGSDPRGLDDQPTAAASSGTSATLTNYHTVITARVRNGGEWSAPFETTYTLTSSPHPTSLVVNEYNAVDKDDGAWAGSDPLFVGDPRNGGDWIEFVVVEDMDLRGWSVELWDRDRSSDKLKMTDKFVFANAPMLASLKAGTLFTISEDHAEDATYDVPGKWDWSFNIQASELTASALLTPESNVNFNVNHKDFRVVIRNANGDIVSPVAMGETEGWDLASGNVSPSEIMALCVTPAASIDVPTAYNDEKLTSTFGQPNVCGGVPQDLTPLRGRLGDVNCDGQINVVDALFIMQSEVSIRSDAGTCPLTDTASRLNADRGNVNRDASMNVVDALFIMQCEVGINNAFCPE